MTDMQPRDTYSYFTEVTGPHGGFASPDEARQALLDDWSFDSAARWSIWKQLADVRTGNGARVEEGTGYIVLVERCKR